jgi:hypothetical protein
MLSLSRWAAARSRALATWSGSSAAADVLGRSGGSRRAGLEALRAVRRAPVESDRRMSAIHGHIQVWPSRQHRMPGRTPRPRCCGLPGNAAAPLTPRRPSCSRRPSTGRWCILPTRSTGPPGHTLRGFGQTELALAGDGAPRVAELAVPEFAASVGLSTESGKHYLGEAVELRFRLPALWGRVCSGDLPAWKARRVARETIRLSPEAAAFVDTHVAPVAHTVSPAQLDRVVAEAVGRFMPEEVERLAAESWDKRRVTLHDQLVSFTGTMHLEADLDLADALDFDAAVAAGAALRADLGSTEPLDGRRAQAVGVLPRGQLLLELDGPTPGRRPKPRQVLIHVHLSEAAVRVTTRWPASSGETPW